MSHPVDVYVGKKIRYRRWALGMTQAELGERIGVKFQQVQKYELGANRISASRLWEVSKALEVPISFFFIPEEKLNSCAFCESNNYTLPEKV